MQYVNGKAVLDLLIIIVLKSCGTVDTKFFFRNSTADSTVDVPVLENHFARKTIRPFNG